jgi:hypothetical protein
MVELQETDSLQALPLHILSMLSQVTTWFCLPQVERLERNYYNGSRGIFFMA